MFIFDNAMKYHDAKIHDFVRMWTSSFEYRKKLAFDPSSSVRKTWASLHSFTDSEVENMTLIKRSSCICSFDALESVPPPPLLNTWRSPWQGWMLKIKMRSRTILGRLRLRLRVRGIIQAPVPAPSEIPSGSDSTSGSRQNHFTFDNFA